MKIIVTGGAGFIGSHIVDAYVKAGHRVAVIDNLSFGSVKNIHPKAKLYKADVKDLESLWKIFAKEKPDAVNHHAGIADVHASVGNPMPTFETNVTGTMNVLLAFNAHGEGNRRRFIFASSGGAVYGEPKRIPAREGTPALPISPYGLSKFLGEKMIEFYGRQSGFSYMILRYANVYGPRQKPKGEAGVVPVFRELMEQGKRPKIFGDGTKTRDYVFVEDIARANLLALRKGKNEVLNFGSGAQTSDKKLFDLIAVELKFRQKPVYAPFRKGEIYKTALDAGRAKKIIGWQPKTSLLKGIKITLAAPR